MKKYYIPIREFYKSEPPEKLTKKEAKAFLKKWGLKWHWDKFFGDGDIECFCGNVFSNASKGRVLTKGNIDIIKEKDAPLKVGFWNGSLIIRHGGQEEWYLQDENDCYTIPNPKYTDCPVCDVVYQIGYWRTCEPLWMRILEDLGYPNFKVRRILRKIARKGNKL